ncbi:hypothetical protein WJX81_003919 [Elliptochloris bilobata]|uniref:Ribosomal RNA-processing protein 42 n=1 Tax=Elliptochloris bilobata TaxID=381761 RepID=A0AAW1S935_9CHLO
MLHSKAERAYLQQGFDAGLRSDGRGCHDWRPVEVALAQLPQASGSARCCVGGTEVLVSVKAEVRTPTEEAPGCGGIQLAVEVSPCAGLRLQGRGDEELGAELTRALERCLLSQANGAGGCLDLSALCIVAGKSCWVLCVDALVLSADGCVLDALSIAAKAALADTRIPLVEVTQADEDGDAELELDDDPTHAARLDTARVPVLVTVSQVGAALAVDLNAEEGACAGAALEVAVDARGRLCGATMRAHSAPLHPSSLQEMLGLAQRLGPRLLRELDRQIGQSAAAASVAMQE